MSEEIKYMNVSPQFVFELDKILDYLVENEGYEARFGLTTIKYEVQNEKSELFTVMRKKEE